MKQRGARWTTPQDERLEELVKAKTPRVEIAKLMERTLRGIERRITERGLRQDMIDAKATRTRKAWDVSEDNQMEGMLKAGVTLAEAAATLNRTPRGLRDRAVALGIAHLIVGAGISAPKDDDDDRPVRSAAEFGKTCLHTMWMQAMGRR